MTAFRQLTADGGPVILLLIGLSVLLYARCFHLLAFLLGAWRRLRAVPAEASPDRVALRRKREELEEAFDQQRRPIVAMIAAAPLAGLLGTVMGMSRAFGSLAAQGDRQSMENLARGISEVLLDTESGLAVAIPALLLLCWAHGILHQAVQRIGLLENRRPRSA